MNHLDMQNAIKLKAFQLDISTNLQWLGSHSPSDVFDESILNRFSHCWHGLGYLYYHTNIKPSSLWLTKCHKHTPRGYNTSVRNTWQQWNARTHLFVTLHFLHFLGETTEYRIGIGNNQLEGLSTTANIWSQAPLENAHLCSMMLLIAMKRWLWKEGNSSVRLSREVYNRRDYCTPANSRLSPEQLARFSCKYRNKMLSQ